MEGIQQARASHADAARTLLEKRTRQCGSTLVQAEALTYRERQLEQHLYGGGQSQFDPGAGAREAFLHWGARLLVEREAAVELASWLGDAGEGPASGGLDALTWRGCRDWMPDEAAAADGAPELGGAFWRSWADRGVNVPDDVIAPGLASESADTRAAVTDYLTRSRRLVRRDWALPSPGDDPATDVAVAQRSITDGELTVEAAAERLGDTTFDAVALRAAAGDPTVVPLLAAAIDDDADRVLPLAGLSGTVAGAEVLLDALGNPRFQFGALAGWYILTGERLGLAPVMQPVGGTAPSARQGRSPDVNEARRWLKKHRDQLEQVDVGLLMGKPLSEKVFRQAVVTHGGEAITWLLDVGLLRLGCATAGVAAQQPCALRVRAADELLHCRHGEGEARHA